jgi:PleD family two-component response regulator
MPIRLLIVDDSPDLGKMLVTYFGRHDCQAEWLGQGQETLEKARRFRPHVILLDVMMPELDGHALYHQLRSHHRTSHIPILFLTALSSRDDIIAGLGLGAEDYVVKPFDFDELRLRVKNIYNRSQRESPTDPVTGLPGRQLIDEYVRGLPAGAGFSRLDCRLRGFDEFREVYGFLAADDVLRLTAGLLDEMAEAHGQADAFVGHPGGAEFTLVAKGPTEAIARRLAERFDREVLVCYSFIDRGRGYLVTRPAKGDSPEKRAALMTLEIASRGI